jgi:phosphoglycolate phosphatase-like HAD superfamily hydrolase
LIISSNIKHLIFDLDGTLIDSSEGVVIAVNRALESIGEKMRRPEEIKRFIGFPLEQMFQFFSNKSYKDFWENFQRVGIDEIATSAIPICGADETLHLLYGRGYKLGIGTTKMRIHLEKIITKLNWTPILSAFIGADDVAQVKPAPDVFIKVMQLLGGDISNSLVIGDTINDVIAAHSAGLPVVAVHSPFGDNRELEKSRPDVIIQNIKELPSVLGIIPD